MILNANDPDPDPVRTAAFAVFMKTDNGRGMYYLLANYHQAFGGKIVTQVLLKKPLANQETEDGTGRASQALIVLSDTSN